VILPFEAPARFAPGNDAENLRSFAASARTGEDGAAPSSMTEKAVAQDPLIEEVIRLNGASADSAPALTSVNARARLGRQGLVVSDWA
jgi:hypothetical protein